MRLCGVVINIFGLSLNFLGVKCDRNQITDDINHGRKSEFQFSELLKTFYCSNTTVVDVIFSNENEEILDAFNSVSVHFGSCTSFQFDSLNNVSRLHKRKRTFNVIILESFESFNILMNNISNFDFDFNGYFSMFFIDIETIELNRVFEFAWKYFMHNFIVLTGNGTEITLSTYDPYQNNRSCGNTQALSSVFNANTDSIKLFPDKLANMHKCPLRLPKFEYYPATFYEEIGNETMLKGIDGDLVMTMKGLLNFTLDFVSLENPDEKWGSITENGSATGAMKMVVDGTADFTIGMYVISPLRLKFMDSTISHVSFPFVLIVPPGQKYTSFEKLFKPFSWNVWITVGVTFLLSSLIILFVKRSNNQKLKYFFFGAGYNPPYFYIIDAFFGGSLQTLPKSTSPRILLSFFLFYSLILRTIYQGNLVKILQSDDRSRPVMTVDEMIENDFHFYMYPTFIEHSRHLKFFSRRKIYPTIENEEYLLKTLDPYFKGGVCCTLDEVAAKNKQNRNNYTLRVLPEDIYLFKNGIYFRKNMPIVELFDKKISLFHSSGLINFWVSKYLDLSYAKISVTSETPKKLSIEQLEGIFLLWLYGLLTATTFLVLENIYSKTLINVKETIRTIVGKRICLFNYVVESENHQKNLFNFHQKHSSFPVFKILETFYCKESSVVDVICSNESEEILDAFNSVIAHFGSCTSFQFDSLNNVSRLHKRTRTFNVIILESFESFNILMNNISNFDFDFNGYFSMFFIDIETIELNRVFEFAWKYFMHNFIVLTGNGTKITLSTYDPFRNGICGDTSPVSTVIDIKTDIHNSIDLFPNKMINMNKCPLRIPLINYLPAINFESYRDDYIITGIEGELLLTMKDLLNFTIKVLQLKGEQYWGVIEKNGSATGAMRMVIEGEADLIMGTYAMTLLRLQYMDSSLSHLGFPFVLVIPPGRKFTPMEKLLKPFQMEIWIAILTFLGFLFMSILIIKKGNIKARKLTLFGETFRLSYLTMIDSFLGGSFNLLPSKTSLRFLFASYFIFCLIVRNLYQGLLVQILQSEDRAKPVKTVDEMMEKGFNFYMYDSYLEHTEHLKFSSRRKVHKYNDNEKYLKMTLDPNFKGGVCSSLDEVAFLNKKNYKNFSYLILPEDVYLFKYVIYFQKHSPYVKKFNEKISLFKSSGLLEFWFSKYMDLSYVHVKEPKMVPRTLNIEQLKGGFILWLCGCSISLFVFILEAIYSVVIKYLL
ncbi:CLUMA_CG017663, isoform A [Clunio marinus]|uniref:CLUMA_CG017663, isoform A n=1 Tax=Clunio marinus TaxID=568069 RepID=A0A1J1IWD6_9DIPT|nr:CLUMA_CG017663, isoform A [Clunio marinus]